jgi:ATP-dependent DNA ligase
MRRSGAARLESLPKRKAEFIEPMECALVSELPEGSQWTYEVKLDGYRAIGVRTSSETVLYSRNHKNFNKRFPQIVEALRSLPADTIIDGEVVTLDESGRPDFHRLQHFTAEASRIRYFVFDLIILRGRDLTSLAVERTTGAYEDAQAALAAYSPLRAVPHFRRRYASCPPSTAT